MCKIVQKKGRKEERKKRESYDQMIHSRLASPASTQDFEEDRYK